MATVHRARISPLLPTTEWTLEGGELVERRGARVRRFPLSDLRRLSIADGLARADFARGRVRIPAQSFASGLRVERHDDTFSALTEALAAQGADAAPQVRLTCKGLGVVRSRLTNQPAFELLGIRVVTA